MIAPLTRENLQGVWAAIPTPFDADGDFDAEVSRSTSAGLPTRVSTASTRPVRMASSTRWRSRNSD